MSGSTIGGIAGALVGSFFGPVGAKIGWMIGSLAGGYVDPQKIEGPRLKDATRQTSQDGIPIPFGYGSFPTTGNLIWTDRLVETKSTKRQGKGGPKVPEYVYTRSYAIGVCEGEIAGYLIGKRNGKIVYDTRTNAELTAAGYTSAQIAESRAAQAKWQEFATLYYGNEVQLPDPTITAVKGAGNVPAYRGLAYIVLTDEDLTQERGAVPQYEFVVSVCGERTEETGAEDWRWLGTGQTGAGTRASIRPMGTSMTWSGVADTEATSTNTTSATGVQRYGDKMFAIIGNSTCRVADVSDVTTWSAGPTGLSLGTTPLGHTSAFGGRLWVACGDQGLAYLGSTTDASFTTITSVLTLIPLFKRRVNAVTGNGTNVLCVDSHGAFYASSDSGASWAAVADIFGSGNRFFTSYGALDSNGDRVVVAGGETGLRAAWSDNNGASFTDCGLPASSGELGNQVKYCGNSRWLIACTGAGGVSDGLYKSTDNGENFTAVTLPDAVEFNLQSKKSIAADAVTGRVVIAGTEVGTGTRKFYYSDDLSSWTAIGMSGTDVTGITEVYPPGSASPVSGTELPDSPGHYVDEDGVVNGPAGTTVDRCTPELGTDIIADLCARREVTDIDVSELTDLVDGFKVATETDPATAIDSTRAAYFYDASEYDGVIHFPKRGGSPVFALTMDDLAARDGDPIEWERVQEAELLRKVTVAYIDPATTYTQTTQKWERRTGTVEAKGEGSVEIPVVGTKDFAAQVAEMRGKAAWAETDKCRFSLPYKWAKLTPADVGTLTDALGKVHRIRILSIEDDSGYRHIEAVREQTNTYVSTAVGSSGPNPTYPGSGLAGPTVAAIMNLPVLRDEDDKAGLYIAAAGMLSGWQGALIQMARDGATFENGPVIAANATMGELVAALPTASRYAQDNANTLTVRLLPTSGDLSSTTYDGLIESEANSAAILYADGTAEIIQFQTATLDTNGDYELTGLMRGRQDTVIATHAIGARFVLLDDAIRFAAIKASDVGKTLTFRPVSVGTAPGSNATQTITMMTIQSLREWSPYNVTVEWDGVEVGEGEGVGYCVNWIGRARLGNSRAPAHSQWLAGYRVTFTSGGVTYEVDATDQSYCATAAELTEAFGLYGQPTVTVRALSRIATNDDDFSSPPSAPSTSPPATTANGTPASTAVGPNGGFPDDAPFPIAPPTVFGSDLIGTGGFADSASLLAWRDRLGNPLGSDWEVTGGKAQFSGSAGTAYGYAWRLSQSPQPFPRYSITVTAKVQTTGGQTARVGVAWGTNTSIEPGSDVPNNIEADAAAQYLAETTVSYTWELERQSEFITAYLYYGHVNFMPVVQFTELDGAPEIGTVDDATMTITEVSVPTTPITLDHLDFDTGLADWDIWPDPSNPYAATVAASGGELSMTPTHELAKFANAYCIDPIDAAVADAVGKYIVIEAEVWCDDPSVDLRGRTSGGAHMYLAPNTVTDGYAKNSVYVAQRGDWTLRKWWYRINTVPSGSLLSYHVCAQMKCELGYSVKVRNIAAAITNAVMD